MGDFNGDGISDLAVTSGVNTTVLSVLLGNGDGHFKAPRGLPSLKVPEHWSQPTSLLVIEVLSPSNQPAKVKR